MHDPFITHDQNYFTKKLHLPETEWEYKGFLPESLVITRTKRMQAKLQQKVKPRNAFQK
jgi:hypothetical protein